MTVFQIQPVSFCRILLLSTTAAASAPRRGYRLLPYRSTSSLPHPRRGLTPRKSPPRNNLVWKRKISSTAPSVKLSSALWTRASCFVTLPVVFLARSFLAATGSWCSLLSTTSHTPAPRRPRGSSRPDLFGRVWLKTLFPGPVPVSIVNEAKSRSTHLLTSRRFPYPVPGSATSTWTSSVHCLHHKVIPTFSR